VSGFVSGGFEPHEPAEVNIERQLGHYYSVTRSIVPFAHASSYVPLVCAVLLASAHGIAESINRLEATLRDIRGNL